MINEDHLATYNLIIILTKSNYISITLTKYDNLTKLMII